MPEANGECLESFMFRCVREEKYFPPFNTAQLLTLTYPPDCPGTPTTS